MSEPTHLPKRETSQPAGYYLGVNFYPQIKLDKKLGFQLAANLADYIEAEHVNFESNVWKFISSRLDMWIAITTSKLEVHCDDPAHKQEWYEDRYRELVRQFAETFSPDLVMGSKAMVRRLMDVDGDARVFILDNLLNVSEQRREKLRRPVHVVGFRLDFPPFEFEATEGEEGEQSNVRQTHSSVDVRIESYSADPRKLLIEVDAQWHEPDEWGEEAVDKFIGRLMHVDEFIEQNVYPFIFDEGSSHDDAD